MDPGALTHPSYLLIFGSCRHPCFRSWNFTPSPGWTRDEAQTLKLLLMSVGVGRWVSILDSGLLPGKMIQQLNGQTQRLLGQQSLAAFTGLHVDIDRIRAENEARTDAPRKSGLIINTGCEREIQIPGSAPGAGEMSMVQENGAAVVPV